MSCVINASTTSGLVMTSDLSGTLQFQNNGVAVPPLTVAPAFSAYVGSAQSVTNATATKIQYNTEEFDTNSNYDNTNYRFTPTVAGYYQVNACVSISISIGGEYIMLFKNGTEFKRGVQPQVNGVGINLASLVYLNGTTDYVEIYAFQGSGTTQSVNTTTSSLNYFQAFLARSA